jgi:hypothetical protein
MQNMKEGDSQMERKLDYLDRLILTAVHQGWGVSQNKTGVWVFRKGTLVISQRIQGDRDLIPLINALRGVGLRFPPPE